MKLCEFEASLVYTESCCVRNVVRVPTDHTRPIQCHMTEVWDKGHRGQRRRRKKREKGAKVRNGLQGNQSLDG